MGFLSGMLNKEVMVISAVWLIRVLLTVTDTTILYLVHFTYTVSYRITMWFRTISLIQSLAVSYHIEFYRIVSCVTVGNML